MSPHWEGREIYVFNNTQNIFIFQSRRPNRRSDKTLHIISIDKIDRSFYCNSLLRIINAVKRARDLLRLLISLILHVYDSNFTLKQVLCLKT